MKARFEAKRPVAAMSEARGAARVIFASIAESGSRFARPPRPIDRGPEIVLGAHRPLGDGSVEVGRLLGVRAVEQWGYTPLAGRNVLTHLGQVGVWLTEAGLEPSQFDEQRAAQFLAARQARGCRRVSGLRGMRPLLSYLRHVRCDSKGR